MSSTRAGSAPRRARLRSRLAVLVLLVVAPLVALSALGAIHDRDQAAERAYARTRELVATGVGVIDAQIGQADLMLVTIGRTTNAVGDACSAELAGAVAPESPYRNLYAVADDGTVDCTAVRQPLGPSVAATDWFRRTLARSTLTVAAPATGLTTDRPVLVVAHPKVAPTEPDEVAPGDPVATGVLAAALDLQALVAFTEPLDLPAGSVVQVLDGGGRVLARTSEAERYLLAEAPLFPRLQGGPAGDLEGRGVDGVDRLYSYERLEVGGQALYVMAGTARSSAYTEADARLLRSLGVIGVLGLAVGVVSAVAGRTLLVAPVERLRAAMAGFRAGDVHRRAGDIGGPSEVVDLGRAFDAMADEIEARLEDQQRLLAQLEQATEAERQSIAAGIHDETLQNLSAVRIRLQLLRRRLDDEAPRDDVDRVVELLDETSAQLRGLLFDLRPAEFDRIGFVATLRETLEVRFGDVLESWSVSGDLDPSVPEAVQTQLYRVFLQALANVREHAEATRVDVRLGTSAEAVTLEVADDGRGFDVDRVEGEDRPGHIGLRVMRDRARSVGGEVRVTSAPGRGTTVRVELPTAP